MKHQYFGDISDYKKYSILREITNDNSKLIVCWMLTSKDKKTDGNVNKYLHSPEIWRKYNPEIFDFLYNSVIKKQKKDLKLVQANNIIPNTNYYWNLLTDNSKERKSYFEKLKLTSSGYDIIFFDPDNGIATPSIKKGRKNSSKYIFLDEILDFWNQNHTLLIYQHFPRVNRIEYIKRKVAEIKKILGNKWVYSIRTTFMVYFLIPNEEHTKNFKSLKKRIEDRWSSQIIVERL